MPLDVLTHPVHEATRRPVQPRWSWRAPAVRAGAGLVLLFAAVAVAVFVAGRGTPPWIEVTCRALNKAGATPQHADHSGINANCTTPHAHEHRP
jgi:hypothetical protein